MRGHRKLLAVTVVECGHFFCRKETERLVRRAEKAGFKALVLTVDTNVFGLRYADSRNKFDLPAHLRYIAILIFLVSYLLRE